MQDIKIPYYKGIDILRGIAVIAVVLFHFDSAYIPSGFLGVDLFFVVSGFVITHKIDRETNLGRFSLKEFYLGRFRRILPLSTIVVLITLLIVPLLVPKFGMYSVLMDAFSALFSYANIWFQQTTGGYWSRDGNESWFLPYWSLGIEEQFYLIFPLLLCYTRKVDKANICLFFIFFVSLMYQLTSFYTNDLNSVFFSTFTRCWQLCLGALVALNLQKLGKVYNEKVLAFVVILVVSSFFVPMSDWTDLYRIPFSVITVVLIVCFTQHPISEKNILNKAGMVVGKMSFSIYLWHWLLFKLIVETGLSESLLVYIFAVALLSYGSYVLIENPFRRKKISLIWVTMLFSLTSIYVGYSLVKMKKEMQNVVYPPSTFNEFAYDISPQFVNIHLQVPKELRDAANFGGKPKTNVGLHRSNEGLSIVQGSGKSILLMGDSHSSMWADCIKVICQSRGWSLNAFCASGLEPYFTIPIKQSELPKHRRFTAIQMNEFVNSKLEAINSGRYDTIILGCNWSAKEYKRSLVLSFVNELSKYARVVLIKEPPKLKIGNKSAVLMGYFQGEEHGSSIFLGYQQSENAKLWNKLLLELETIKGVYLFEPDLLIEDEEVAVIRDGVPVYLDDDHLTMEGTMFSKRILEQLIIEE